jgi:hypothetical protein
MKHTSYRILPSDGEWRIDADGETETGYATREAAFEAVLGPASNALRVGDEVSIVVAAPEAPEPE